MALVLMPFGMGAAIAGPAMAGSAHHAPSAATAGHCNEQGGQPAGHASRSGADCTACSMAMTAPDRVQEPAVAVGLPLAHPLPVRGVGRHPETATPPPKSS